MKGYVLTAALLTAGFFGGNAQLRVAIAGGGHAASVIEKNDVPGFDEYKKGYKSKTGIHFGFTADVPFSSRSNFYFQPGVLYYNRGRKFASAVDDGFGDFIYTNSEQFINYIDIPLNIVYKIRLSKKTKFVLGGGPYGSFFYTGKEKTEVINQGSYTVTENDDLPVGDGPGKYKVLNYGVNGVAGFEFGKVYLTANYTYGLNDFYKAVTYNGSFNHKTIGATLGIYLGKTPPPEKKIVDKDGDGIPDDKDNCPTEAGPAITNGCPDKDGDGIADKDDQCPAVPGILANKGCPAVMDRDGDGVSDDKDKCPNTPGLARYEGCPVPDTDGDGVNDDDDKCPTVVGLGRYEGCPVPDTDGDGVNDELDQCPTIKGLKERNGCPAEEIKKEIIDKVNYAAKRIQFNYSKADLTPASKKVLDEVAALMKQNPELKLAIEGHTSADANFESNMKLSQARADQVKKYLELKGIAAARLAAKGFGPTQPLNEGKTDVEKALNRRVEMKLSN